MEIYEALYTTRAMRRLKPDPIPYDVQARILDAAIRAPHIGEGWRFILVDDPESSLSSHLSTGRRWSGWPAPRSTCSPAR